MSARIAGILFASVLLTAGASLSSTARVEGPPEALRKPIHLADVPRWYWIDTAKQKGLILDWCDAALHTDWIPCGSRILRNWPVLDRDGNLFIAPTIIEYYKE